MYCPQCQSVRESGRFCPTCGHTLEESRLVAPGGERGQIDRPAPLLDTMPAPAPAPTVAAPLNSATNVTVNVTGPQIVYQDKTDHSMLLRAVWFVFVGWWLGEIWLTIAWVLNLTIVGLPLGLMMINSLPNVMTLQSQQVHLSLGANVDGTYTLTRSHLEQLPFWMRAVYFVLVGWWASFLWAEVAWLCCLGIVTIPIGFMMFNKMPAITTLKRY